MTESTIAGESDRVVAAWATGKQTSTEALRALCRILEIRGTIAAVVGTKGDATTIIAPDSVDSRTAPLTAVSERLGAGRSLRNRSDEAFADLVGNVIDGASWVACEPLPGKDTASLVVVGLGEAALDPVLLALPHVALACGSICARAERSDEIAVVAHSMNNSLSSVIGNLEFAMSILAHEPGLIPRLTDEATMELMTAVKHASRGTGKLHARALTLVKLATS